MPEFDPDFPKSTSDSTSCSMAFSATNAIGMFFITADSLFDDDIGLSADDKMASLLVSDLSQRLNDGSDVFFLGLIDDIVTNTDLTVQAPEPSTLAILALGIVGLGPLNMLKFTHAKSDTQNHAG